MRRSLSTTGSQLVLRLGAIVLAATPLFAINDSRIGTQAQQDRDRVGNATRRAVACRSLPLTQVKPDAGTWETWVLESRRQMRVNAPSSSKEGIVELRRFELQRAAVLRTLSGWSNTGNLNTSRALHTATLLPNGKILVVGGLNVAGGRLNFLSSAELYDPSTHTWSSAGQLSTPRALHTATLLPSGQVLVAGGLSVTDPYTVYFTSNRADLYDPATGVWSATGALRATRHSHSATLLQNGKVLVAGGFDTTENNVGFLALSIPRKSAELYDPASGTWSTTGELTTPRGHHTATMLKSGKVLVAAGTDDGEAWIGQTLTSAELFNPETGSWLSTGSLNAPRAYHSATLLPGDKVLVAGGERGWDYFSSDTLDIVEVYDAASGVWARSNPLTKPHKLHTATLLPGGKILVADMSGAELFDPATGTWSDTTPPGTIHWRHTATLLGDGRVLVAGGNEASSSGANSAELFDGGPLALNATTSVSAASLSIGPAAPDSILAAFGHGLATATEAAGVTPLPTSLAGTSVRVTDNLAVERFAPLFYVSPAQINYLLPSGTAPGLAAITVTSGDGTVSTGVVHVTTTSPALFAANSDGEGIAAAVALRVKADGSRSYEPVARFDVAQKVFVAQPIDLGAESDRVFLVLFGTGIRSYSSISALIATISGTYVEVTFAGLHPDFAGVDQVNVLLPRSLIGRGEMDVLLTVDGEIAKPVRINIR